MAKAARVPWYRKKRWWALIAAPFVLFFVVFVAFDPLVEWMTQRTLSKVKGFTITYQDAKLQPTKLNYAITELKVIKGTAGGDKRPMVYVEKAEVGLHWKELLHGNLVAKVSVDGPKVNLIQAKAKSEQQTNELPELAKQLNELMPLRVDRIQVRRGEVTFVDKTQKEVPKVWLHGMEVTVENLATRAALARGEPTVVALSSGLQKKGELSAYITADPLAKGLWFSGQVKAVGLDMREFHDLIVSRTGFTLDEGTLDVFAEFDCRKNNLTGGIRPILKNPKVKQVEGGVANWFKATLADVAIDIFSDRVGNRNAVATTIPIEGNLKAGPEIQLWPTIFGVVRNAFVAGVTESFERLPPPKADGEGDGIAKQAVKALDKGKGPPKAQPDSEERAARKGKPSRAAGKNEEPKNEGEQK